VVSDGFVSDEPATIPLLGVINESAKGRTPAYDPLTLHDSSKCRTAGAYRGRLVVVMGGDAGRARAVDQVQATVSNWRVDQPRRLVGVAYCIQESYTLGYDSPTLWVMTESLNNSTPNLDHATVDHFGEEWSSFKQDEGWGSDGLDKAFAQYFATLPSGVLNLNAVVGDFGAGSGRWATKVAPLVSQLYVLEPSPAAMAVARQALRFTKTQITEMLVRAGFDTSTLVFSDSEPFWCFSVRAPGNKRVTAQMQEDTVNLGSSSLARVGR
jgi:hypothetical protein